MILSITLLVSLSFQDPEESQQLPEPIWNRIILAIVSDIKTKLVKAEILDQREKNWYLVSNRDLLADTSFIMRRVVALRDHPLTSDLVIFHETNANHGVELCEAYRSHLASKITIYTDWISAAKTESNQILDVYSKLKEASDLSRYILQRRIALSNLRDILGNEDYYAGRIPSPAPIWRFARVEKE